ncbi:hypothetical protein IQ244_01185 [Nostoc sp. LEGE 06077]|nr:hypothetical protein [Nostoc sp. LEGE 06077]MBE9205171.1 hypothetical protein [Nostoc sp. LEGE 06077]
MARTYAKKREIKVLEQGVGIQHPYTPYPYTPTPNPHRQFWCVSYGE